MTRKNETAAGKPAATIPGAATDLDKQREVVQQATEALAQMAARYMWAAQSITRMVMRVSTLDDPVKLVTSIAKYQQSALPEPEALTSIATMLEATKPSEWREKRDKQRRVALREKLKRQLSRSELPPEDLPDWGRALVLRIAMEKSATLAAAVHAIERGSDGDGEILRHLSNYLAGRYGIGGLQYALKRAGVAPGQSNVIPLPRRR